VQHIPFPQIGSERGFTLAELLVSSTISLLVTAAALTTFRSALTINDSAAQMSDANQNLRAGTNHLVRDLMMAGRIIGPEGINVPTGAGVAPFNRPGPGAGLTFNLVVDADTTLNLPDIVTGAELGPTINGSHTDVVTIMLVDEFMPSVQSPPVIPNTPTAIEGTIDPAGASLTLPANSYWLVGDTSGDTPAIQVGDLVFFKNANGNAIQTVTRKDATHIYFDMNHADDWFQFNQRTAPMVPIILMKQPPDTAGAWTQKTSLFRALMITYYIDAITTPGTPRITRVRCRIPTQSAG
jgi:prepilin-type N-terminal cleavage/methylation domain-containing protein